MQSKWPSLKIGDTAWTFDQKTTRVRNLSPLGRVERLYWKDGEVRTSLATFEISSVLFGPPETESLSLLSFMAREHEAFSKLPNHFLVPGRLALLHMPWRAGHHLVLDRMGGQVLVFRTYREEEMVPILGPAAKVIDWAIVERKNQGVWSTTIPLQRFLEKPEAR
jgi:hypothetical protein